MPVLPRYQGRVGVAQDRGPAQSLGIGDVISQMGKVTGKAYDVLVKEERDKQIMEANSLFTDAQGNIYEKYQEIKAKNKSLTGEGIARDSLAMYDDWTGRTMKSARSEFMRDLLSSKMEEGRLTLFNQARQAEIGIASNNAASQLSSMLERSSNMIRVNPQASVASQQEGSVREAIESNPALDSKLKPALLKKATNEIYGSMLDGMVSNFLASKPNDPKFVEDYIQYIKDYDLIKNTVTDEKFDSELSRLERYGAGLRNKVDQLAIKRVKEATERYAVTGRGSPKQLRSAIAGIENIDPKVADDLREGVNSAVMRAKVNKEVAVFGLDKALELYNVESERTAIKGADDTLTFDIQKGYSKAREYLKELKKEYDNDPAGISMQLYPDLVRSSYEKLVKSGFTDKDAWNQYHEDVSSVQKKLDPYGRVQPLTKQLVDMFSSDIEGARFKSKGLDGAVETINHIHNLVGGSWPEVYNQLRNNTDLPAGIIATAPMWSVPGNDGLKRTLLESTLKSKEDLESASGLNYGKVEKKAVELLQPFTQSIQNAVPEQFSQMFNAYKETLTSMALWHQVNTKEFGSSTDGDIEDYMEKVLKKIQPYTYLGEGFLGGIGTHDAVEGVRVHNKYNADRVESGLEDYHKQILKHATVPGVQRALVMDDIYWMNNGDDRMQLYSGPYRNAVLDKRTGKSIVVDNSQLENMGVELQSQSNAIWNAMGTMALKSMPDEAGAAYKWTKGKLSKVPGVSADFAEAAARWSKKKGAKMKKLIGKLNQGMQNAIMMDGIEKELEQMEKEKR